MAESLSSIVDSLKGHLRRLEQQRETALETIDHMEAEMRKIDSALKTLLGETKPRAKPGPKKKGITGPQVTALVERVLRDEGPLTQPKLRERVVERARSEGKSAKGLPLVLSKILKSGPFEFNGARWALMDGAARS